VKSGEENVGAVLEAGIDFFFGKVAGTFSPLRMRVTATG
jgi:hypothetical protein